MRAYLITLLAFACFAACRKESLKQKSGPLTFDIEVSGASAFAEDNVSAAETPVERFNFIHYYAYNAEGILASSKVYKKGEADFGLITDKLEAGTYQVILVGLKGENTFFLPAEKARAALIVKDPEEEVFLDSRSMLVAENGEHHEFVIKRVTSLLRVQLEEIFTDNIDKLSVSVANEYDKIVFTTGDVDATTSSGTVKGKVKVVEKQLITAEDRRSPVIETPIVNTQFPVTITLRAHEGSKVVKQLAIPNVVLQRNKKMILKGKLFRQVESGGSVRVDDNWSSEIVIEF